MQKCTLAYNWRSNITMDKVKCCGTESEVNDKKIIVLDRGKSITYEEVVP